ncbi:MAG: tryptophan--tRNA ligase [Nocardioidaceae bacterium]
MTTDISDDIGDDRRHNVLSGITPSGRLTLGNHLGALRRFADSSTARPGEATFFVADLHALTSDHDPVRLVRLTRETVLLFLAAGIDPKAATVFVQSQVPQHVELAYLLECTAHVGELSRMIQYKEKVGRGGRVDARASLFTYPCLMAADILAYDTDAVPVGGDQDQHVELTRDLALRFNRLYGTTFVVPRLARAALAARVADLAKPQAKMSKSATDDAPGVIRLLDPPDVVRRKVMRAVTDSDTSVRYDTATKPGVSNLIEILGACTGEPELAHVAEEFATYGALKKATADAVIAVLSPLQERYAELARDQGYVDGILADGAERASARAGRTVARARAAIGLR